MLHQSVDGLSKYSKGVIRPKCAVDVVHSGTSTLSSLVSAALRLWTQKEHLAGRTREPVFGVDEAWGTQKMVDRPSKRLTTFSQR